ncbi:cyclohexanone monooxygenase [Microbacterium sorbitolivorans]|uniref:NAD(P)/FAD-dependent oxidoreductase n=1 Tax=Microbacterium sorbitolivorans TaxID=1867410 RepID=A0A367Y4D7_9MICO|nr:NAD(P)/FAD-dependent oxidoreductase [Microbacterium sorbitolivorans]RCK59892.1 NAD(P)/FAD-dependent oxidoreductase [Microbacterium sorbitolivorans]GGF40932.1 cyclohexanone monooxygenase [Microbacterium sorbitolivorans]
MTVRVDALIIGAGFAGIAQGLTLRDAGVRSFFIAERAESVGGTWRDNSYPGIACDVPSHLYGLETHPWPGWSRVFAPGAEIREYLERVVVTEGLDRHLLLGSTMTSARWDGSTWHVTLTTPFPVTPVHNDANSRPKVSETGTRGGRGQKLASLCTREVVADSLILAAGRLTEPKIPQIPGLHTFPGPMFHSARWRHDLDLADKRVAVVGTGATAIQLAPALARLGARVTLFQRTPAWIVPRGDRAVDGSEMRAYEDDPALLARHRDELYAEGEARFASRSGDPDAAAAAERIARDHLAAQVADPLLREQLTPGYAFGCKRVLLSDDFYPAIADGSIALEPSALAAVRGSRLVAASGASYDADVVVLATGFETTRQPYAALVMGEFETLDEHWARGMTAVASTLVSGFPNLYVLNGPNASLGHNSSILISEAQARFAAGLIARGDRVSVTAEAERESTADIARRAARTPWLTGGCQNWYVDERSGALALLWPGTVAEFRQRLEGTLP